MCFNIHSQHPDWLVRSKAITCYKMVRVKRTDGKPYKGKKIKTHHRRFYYVLNQKYTVNNFGINGTKEYIYKGFHSYTSLRKVKDVMDSWNGEKYNPYRIMKCSIPARTKYYYNPRYQEYVSLALITKEIVKYVPDSN